MVSTIKFTKVKRNNQFIARYCNERYVLILSFISFKFQGSAMLRMMRAFLGEDNFIEGLKVLNVIRYSNCQLKVDS